MNEQPIEKLSWREKYAGTLVLLIGVLYLILQVINLLSSKADRIVDTDGKLVISKAEILSDLRTYLYILFGITAGILLLRKKKWGWILGVPYLCLYIVIAVWGTLFSLQMGFTGAELIVLVAGVVVLLLALLFLLLPSALKKYKVGSDTILPTLVFLICLAVLYFFLQ